VLTDVLLRPTRLLASAPRRTAGALANARTATLDLVAAVSDRLVLTDLLDDECDDPGSLHALTEQECRDVLGRGQVGRLAYIARAGVPDIAPVNYTYVGGAVLIRSGPGPKLQAAERGDRVAFEVDELDGDRRTGRSVIVYGVARRAGQIAAHEGPQPWAAGPRRHLIQIDPRRITGRSVG